MTTNSISDLPVINALLAKLDSSTTCFDNITLVCVQHLLYTTIDLIKACIQIGIKPDRIHIMGKLYSSCPEVIKSLKDLGLNYYQSSTPSSSGSFEETFIYDVRQMWSQVINQLNSQQVDGIIVLDDGAKCIVNTPTEIVERYKVIGIEQTASGVTYLKSKKSLFPVITVAFSAAKQILESPMIADAVYKKLDQFLPPIGANFVYGVVGLGVIGKSIVNKLLSLNEKKIIVYDQEKARNCLNTKVTIASDVSELILKSDYIFGCTGDDITRGLDLTLIQNDKVFISCSSQDKEFNSFLRTIAKTFVQSDVLQDIRYKLRDNVMIKIFKGGYPVNFDGSGESVPARDIQLTRGLLLGGVIQAASFIPEMFVRQEVYMEYMLDPKIQQFVANTWGENGSFKSDNLKAFANREWIKNNSGGEYIYNRFIDKILAT